MKKIAYYMLYGAAYAVSLLPFWLLYVVSDGLYLLVYHVIGYRRKLVRKNIATSFPEKSKEEIDRITRQFYHWFCDYIFETLKLLSISNEKLLRHIEFRGVDQLEDSFDQGQNCAAILGHYCNWEWLSATGLAFQRHPQAVMGLIYHPLYSDAFNQLFIDIRSAHGGSCIPKQDILRHLVGYRKENRRSLFGYISDQAPKWENTHLWLPFLNHDTGVFTGGERIMRKMDDAVFYVDMERPCRGQYICTFRLIAPHAAQTEEFDITRRFFQMLEASVTREPANYLWTHNRWKRSHEEFDRRLEIVDGKTRWRPSGNLVPKLREMPERFRAGEGELLYKGRNEVRCFEIEGKKVVVKQFKAHDWLKRIIYTFFRKNKARRAYENAKELRLRHFVTPPQIDYLQRKRHGLIWQTYYICEYTDAQPIRPRLIEQEPFDRPLAEAYARYVAQMHEAGVLHRDLNPTNVLYREENGTYHFELIDINRMRFYDGPVPKAECMENLTLFWWLSDVFRFVLDVYAAERGWTQADIDEAIRVKERHDRHWVHRKRFTALFKKKK